MRQIDINCDLGESFGNYSLGNDALIMPYISSANIACGFHAGDPLIMEQTVKLALEHNIHIGAHPGYPDLQGFGRRSIKMSPAEIRSMLVYQISALKGITESLGGHVSHVKPHGALYNDAVLSDIIANAIIEAVLQIDPTLTLYALAGSNIHNLAKKKGLLTISEVFADRAYMPSGELAPRKMNGAVIHDIDTAMNRVLQMVKEHQVEDLYGNIIEINAESVCIHGDNPEAVQMAKKLHQFLSKQGLQIKS